MSNKYIVIFLAIVFCIAGLDAAAQESDTTVSTNSTPIRPYKKFSTYFNVSFPLGLGVYERFRITSGLDLMAGLGVGLPIPWLSVPFPLGIVGSAIRLGSPDSSGNAYSLSGWFIYHFPMQGYRFGTSIALMWGRFITTDSRFKWGIGLTYYGWRLILPAFELSLRLGK